MASQPYRLISAKHNPAHMITEFCSHDCEELSESLAHTEQVFRQLQSGPFVGRWRLLQLPGVSIVEDEISHGIYNAATVKKGFLIVFLPIRLRGRLITEGHSYEKPALFMAQQETRPILSIPANFMSYTIEFDLKTLCRTCEALGLPLSSSWECIPNASMVDAGRRMVDQAFCNISDCQFRSPQEKADALIVGWLSLMAEASGQDWMIDRSSLMQRRSAAIDAANFMLDNLCSDLSLVDLCEAAHVSERTLRNGFIELFGMSPKRWFKRERLAAARRDLKAADPKLHQVSEIAVRYGFTQFAHFATDYRKQYDESPSQTLRCG